MKHHARLLRCTAILLAVLLIFGNTVMAETRTPQAPQTQPQASVPDEERQPAAEEAPAEDAEPEEEAPAFRDPSGEQGLTDEELCAQYQIADNWARPALLFAVRSGLLRGRSDGSVDQTANCTRAEVAAILMRLMDTKSEGDLSSFRDVNKNAWYYHDLARAYALGVVNGTGSGTMSPNERITREPAFVMLARLFGVKDKSLQGVLQYDDWPSVGNWARMQLSAMVEAGFVSGDNNKLRPKDYITRQEFAQVLYKLVQGAGHTVENGFTGSYVLSADTVPAGTVINGDLLLSNECQAINLRNVTVTGKLIVQGRGYLYLSVNNCSIGELVLCRNTDLYIAEGRLSRVRTLGTLTLSHGSVDSLESWGADVIVGKDGVVGGAGAMQMCTFTVNGLVKYLALRGMNVTVKGSGHIEEMVVLKKGYKLELKADVERMWIDYGPEAITVSRTDTLRPTLANPTVTATVKLTNVPSEGKYFLVQWYLGDEAITGQRAAKLREGMTLSCDVNFQKYLQADANNQRSAPVRLVITIDSESYGHIVLYDVTDGVAQAAKAVRTENVKATVRRNTTLYRDSSLSGYLSSVSKGTEVIYITYSGITAAYVQLPSGARGWVPYDAISVWTSTLFFVDWDYSKDVKEYWVNNVKQASSKTKYLIWVSLYTQRVNVFYGSKGSWTLIKTFACASGANMTPTKVQDTVIQYKTKQWNYADFYVHSVSVLDSAGRAFHSRPKYYGSGNVYAYAIGYPVSHGCIRMMDEGCNYIYEIVPTGTRVVIY